MNRRYLPLMLIFVGVLLTSVVVATSVISFESVEYPRTRSVNSLTLEYHQTDSINLASNLNLENSDTLIERRGIYQDQKGNQYTYDEHNLIAFKSAKNYNGNTPSSLYTSKDISTETAIEIVSSEVGLMVNEYSDFELVSMDRNDLGYRLELRRTISHGVFDGLSVQLTSNGEIEWFVVSYCNIDILTEDTKHQFDNFFNTYITKIENENCSLVDYDCRYRKKGDVIIATYDMVFEDNLGAFYAEYVSFSIPSIK